jgi:hypothetical protein
MRTLRKYVGYTYMGNSFSISISVYLYPYNI